MKHISTLLLFVFLFLNKTEAQVKCSKGINSEDAAQLKKLYDATNGNQWSNNTNWNNLAILDWYGIKWTINQDECCVESIELKSNGMTSNLPTDLKFPFLQTLLLSNNQLNGQIPDFDFPELKSLYLSNNKFVGNIPSFSNFKNLEVLYARFNPKLETALPLFDLPKLKELRLESSAFSGKIPAWDLPSLQTADLSSNNFDAIDEKIRLPNLTFLNISNCSKLTGKITDLSNSKKLRHLEANSTKIDLSTNNTFDNLEYLSVQNNGLDGKTSFGLFPNLKTLDISNNEYSGSLDFIDKMPRLEKFVANSNHFEMIDIKKLNPTLKELYLSNNNIRDCVDKVDFSNLITLDVTRNNLTFRELDKIKVSKKTFFWYNNQFPINFKIEYKFAGVAMLYADVGNPNEENIYTWNAEKQVNLTDPNLHTKDSLFVPSFSGVYTCAISNPKYSGLTLKTNEQFALTENEEKPGDFVIYPSVNNGFFNVHFYRFVPYNIKFRVYNANGELVFTKEKNAAPSEVDFDLSNLPNGVYFLEVNSSVKKSVEKFVISK